MADQTEVYPNTINDGDTAWMLTSTALVYLMTPGVGFFYGGMVDHKNVINQLFLSMCCMGLVTVQWILFGYSLAFQLRDGSPGLGGGNWATTGSGLTSLWGKDVDPTYSPTYPQLVHVLYQGAFAVITAALISGGVVGRVKFWPYMLFLLLWTTCVYDPLAHWEWSADGWMGFNTNGGLGAIDFAGGTVVHISSGTSALTAAYVLGKRSGFDHHQSPKPASVPFVMLGATFLWVGWNGFNAGSANSASGIAGVALVSTNACAAAASFTWICLDALKTGKPTLVGGSIGAVVGLVIITPAAGFVQPGWAILMGFLGAIIVWGLLRVKHFLRADDTLDVFISHGCGGITGAFMTGLFAQTDVNPAGPNGAFYGNPIQLGYQVAAICTTVAFASAGTAAILLLLKYTIGIRVPEEHETMGIDEQIHGESYFTLTIADITGQKADPVNIQIRASDAHDDMHKKTPYAGETDSPVSENEKRDHATAIAAAADSQDPPPARQMGSRNVSSSRTREGHAQIQGDNLSSAVAQLVSQLALPGHNYDIGISRSC